MSTVFPATNQISLIWWFSLFLLLLFFFNDLKSLGYKHTELPLRNSYCFFFFSLGREHYYRISYSELSASVVLTNVTKRSERMFKSAAQTWLQTSYHPLGTFNNIQRRHSPEQKHEPTYSLQLAWSKDIVAWLGANREANRFSIRLDS